MKKKILAAIMLGGLLAACGGSATSVVGAWVDCTGYGRASARS